MLEPTRHLNARGVKNICLSKIQIDDDDIPGAKKAGRYEFSLLKPDSSISSVRYDENHKFACMLLLNNYHLFQIHIRTLHTT